MVSFWLYYFKRLAKLINLNEPPGWIGLNWFMLSGLRAMFMDLAMNVVAPGTWSRGMVLGPSECTLVIGHPGLKGFNRPSCLVSFQCSLVVYGLYQV